MEPSFDVLIMGGGLAGLSLARQLKMREPALSILVIERRAHPVPHAAHKVGESTVEIGAHYFAEMLALKQHLTDCQIKKFGFRFFWSDRKADLASVTELGASRALPTGSWQLDRGIFENELARLVRAAGVQFVDGALIRQFELGDGDAAHRVRYDIDGQSRQANARWLIDASGRVGLIKRRLELAEPNAHVCNAVWFRVADRIDVNQWTSDADFRARTADRWRSTIHLVGDGYWVWLIPLSSGSHSVGIVADPSLHRFDELTDFEHALGWLASHQPRLHAELVGRRDKIQDFAFLRNYSYGCKRVFDGQARWAVTGDAGLFLDPFYSPGSDFIAFANCYVTELVCQDRAGRPVGMLASLYERIFFQLYQSMLPIYVDQYPLFGHPQIMPIKVFWDYTFYWGVMCPLYFHRRLTDVTAMARLSPRLEHAQALNRAVQSLLRRWHRQSGGGAAGAGHNRPRMIDQATVEWFAELNAALTRPLANAGQFGVMLERNIERLELLCSDIIDSALLATTPSIDVSQLRALLSNRAAVADQIHPSRQARESLLLALE